MAGARWCRFEEVVKVEVEALCECSILSKDSRAIKWSKEQQYVENRIVTMQRSIEN